MYVLLSHPPLASGESINSNEVRYLNKLTIIYKNNKNKQETQY